MLWLRKRGAHEQRLPGTSTKSRSSELTAWTATGSICRKSCKCCTGRHEGIYPESIYPEGVYPKGGSGEIGIEINANIVETFDGWVGEEQIVEKMTSWRL